MGRTTAWWGSIADVEVAVRCGQEDHRVVWSSGRLRFIDHADLRADNVLNALGAHRFGCSAVRWAWRQGRTALFRIKPVASAARAGDVTAGRVLASMQAGADEQLPERLRRVRALTLAMTWDRRPVPPLPGDHVGVADPLEWLLYEAAERALQRSTRISARELGLVRSGPAFDVRVEREEGPPVCSGWMDSTACDVELRLPARWLADVWIRGDDAVEPTMVVDRRDDAELVLGWSKVFEGAATPELAWRSISSGQSTEKWP